jgi:hypothetical protein
MKHTNKKSKLGDLGERIAAQALNATRNDNWWDPNGDMTLNESGDESEVKTQRRDIYRNMFTVNTMHANQVEKCVKVARLFFVEYDETDVVKIWECTDRKYSIFETRDGRLMAGWPVNKMNLVREIDDVSLAKEMRSLSQSRHFDVNSPYAINKF